MDKIRGQCDSNLSRILCTSSYDLLDSYIAFVFLREYCDGLVANVCSEELYIFRATANYNL